MRARMINIVSAVVLVVMFFAVSYCWSLVLAWCVPGWLTRSPWGVFESVLAILPITAVFIKRLPAAKAYNVRRKLVLDGGYAAWLMYTELVIISIIIAVAIFAGATLGDSERSLLGDINWGNYCNLFSTSVLILIYDMVLRRKNAYN